jgi:hypothetical protein
MASEKHNPLRLTFDKTQTSECNNKQKKSFESMSISLNEQNGEIRCCKLRYHHEELSLNSFGSLEWYRRRSKGAMLAKRWGVQSQEELGFTKGCCRLARK